MRLRISLPAQLFLVICSAWLLGTVFNATTVSFFYTVSLMIKEILGFLLPWMVFFFVSSGILSFKKNAPVVLVIMLLLIFCSNAIAAWCAYGVIQHMYTFVLPHMNIAVIAFDSNITPLLSYSLPPLIRSEYALISAIIIGIIFSIIRIIKFETIIHAGKRSIEKIINIVLIPILPLYVFGFLLKMRYEGLFSFLMHHYGGAVLLIISMQMCYLLIMYTVASRFSLTQTMKVIHNALPSYLTAFATMSSVATLPISMQGAQKNTGDVGLVHMAMPIMANVHLLGDSWGTPILAMVSMLLFKGALPLFNHYCMFVFYFCTSMFAVSGIPGGGILVMTPILISQFNFSSEMIGIITMLYIMLDSFGTAANVMGDGALVIIVHKVLRCMGIK